MEKKLQSRYYCPKCKSFRNLQQQDKCTCDIDYGYNIVSTWDKLSILTLADLTEQQLSEVDIFEDAEQLFVQDGDYLLDILTDCLSWNNVWYQYLDPIGKFDGFIPTSGDLILVKFSDNGDILESKYAIVARAYCEKR